MNTTYELDWLKRWNMYDPSRSALYDWSQQKDISYQSLYTQSVNLALLLKENFQVGFSDRVVVLSRNHWQWLPLFFALQRLGAIMVPANFRLSSRELEFVIENADPKLIIAHSEFLPALNEIPDITKLSLLIWDQSPLLAEIQKQDCVSQTLEFDPQITPQTPVMMLYTSGTTGRPKGALIHHEMIFFNSINTSLRLDLRENDSHVSFLPFFHTGGWNVLLTPSLHKGARSIICERFDPDQVLEIIERERVSILFGVPTMMDMMARSKRFEDSDLSSLRFAVVGGEPMPIPLIELWQSRGVPIRQGYGLTEFGPNVFSLSERDSIRKKGSIGLPNFYIEARVVNEAGQDIGPHEVGELWLKGPSATKGYWQNESGTRDLFHQDWLKTGDLVRQDEEGFYFVVGRSKDMFISGGENVYPPEVEQALREHPEVQDVAVIGVSDEQWGEVGKAFIVSKTGLPIESEDLKSFCLQRLAKFKIPKHFIFIDDLPKGDSGKILKRNLQEL